MTARTLTGRRLEIVEGRSGLPAAVVQKYVSLWRRQGYLFPGEQPTAAVTSGPKPEIVQRIEAQLTRRHGVGTEVSKILRKFGISSGDYCECEHESLRWDANGVAWCEANREELIAKLTAAAAKHNGAKWLPAKRWGAAKIVNLAIARAKANEKGTTDANTSIALQADGQPVRIVLPRNPGGSIGRIVF